MNSLVSIIVPVYKVERYLRKCIDSIQKQTYEKIEIILVDDGSPDNCGKICEELATGDKRIKVIHQNNGGLANARNSGLDYALNGNLSGTNHYIAFVDSDDTIDRRMVETLVEMMESGDYDVSICGNRIVKEEEILSECELKGKQALNKEELWDEVFGHLNNAAWNKLYKAELIGGLRFPVGIVHGEDLIFNIQYIARCNNAIITKTQFYNYLKRSDSITTGNFSESKLMEVTSKDKAKELIKNYCPEQINNAELFCFRARMNVLRSIYKSKQEDDYAEQVKEYKNYIQINYNKISPFLKMKERIEYLLLERFFIVYKKCIECL